MNTTINSNYSPRAGDVISTYTPFFWYRPGTWMAPPIRYFTKEKYTHSAIVVEIWGRFFVAEALASGIIMRPLKEFPDGMDVLISRPEFDRDISTISMKALSKVGHTGFDYSSLIFHQLFYKLTGKWIGWTKSSTRASDKFYCSEYVAWIYNFYFPEWHLTTPDMIFNHPGFKTVWTGTDKQLAKFDKS